MKELSDGDRPFAQPKPARQHANTGIRHAGGRCTAGHAASKSADCSANRAGQAAGRNVARAGGFAPCTPGAGITAAPECERHRRRA
jgi:hypothetical protein